VDSMFLRETARMDNAQERYCKGLGAMIKELLCYSGSSQMEVFNRKEPDRTRYKNAGTVQENHPCRFIVRRLSPLKELRSRRHFFAHQHDHVETLALYCNTSPSGAVQPAKERVTAIQHDPGELPVVP
jgi:hypothetical protein